MIRPSSIYFNQTVKSSEEGKLIQSLNVSNDTLFRSSKTRKMQYLCDFDFGTFLRIIAFNG